MFVALIWTVVVIVALALCYAYSGSGDVFHPLMFIGPMFCFMYAWMPLKLNAINGLAGFFQADQLEYVQRINVLGVAGFLLGCLCVGCRLPANRAVETKISSTALLVCAALFGSIGVGCWVMAVIHGTDGDLSGYHGGWDDSGYVRDGSLLIYPSFLLVVLAANEGRRTLLHIFLFAVLIIPPVIEAAFTARRGPTFMIAVVLTMGFYMHSKKRPSLALAVISGGLLGLLMLFLVSNRQNIYLGSDRELTTDVTSIVEKPDAGNEYIYGAGTILSTEQRDSFYWGRRYLAEVFVRPIPSSIWPTKYEDCGLSELKHNAGTGEGLMETLGWEGAVGSAPGLIADLWTEFHWLNILAVFLLGILYGWVWRKALISGGIWISQYVIFAALSIYFVTQTMEAVIFRVIILSGPLWLAWRLGNGEVTQPENVECEDSLDMSVA